MSEEPLLQSRTFSWSWDKNSELVVRVLSDFGFAQENLFNLAENTIRQGAIYDVKEDTKVEMMGSVELNGVYLCMHINLRPLLLAQLGDTRGRPICLLEKDGMVVSGYFLKKPGECFGLCDDTRLINLSALTKSCECFLKSLRERSYTIGPQIQRPTYLHRTVHVTKRTTETTETLTLSAAASSKPVDTCGEARVSEVRRPDAEEASQSYATPRAMEIPENKVPSCITACEPPEGCSGQHRTSEAQNQTFATFTAMARNVQREQPWSPGALPSNSAAHMTKDDRSLMTLHFDPEERCVPRSTQELMCSCECNNTVSSSDTSSSINDGEDVHTCQPPQPKRRCVYPVSQAITKQEVLGTPEHIFKNSVDHMPPNSITTSITLSAVDKMKMFIRWYHSGLSTADTLEALKMYMSNLEKFCVTGSIPFWWPLGLHHEEYINLNKENLISVIAHLLLHHRCQFRKDFWDLKPWTARFRPQNFLSNTSQVAMSHSLRKLTEKESSDTSFAPPRSVMAGKQAMCSSSTIDLKPLRTSALSKDVWKRLGLNKTSPIHKSLMEDAKKARDSLSSDPDKLSTSARVSLITQKPYKWSEISTTAKYKKALEMADNATTELSHYYQLGEYETNVARENWVATWYLWYSFRNRVCSADCKVEDIFEIV